MHKREWGEEREIQQKSGEGERALPQQWDVTRRMGHIPGEGCPMSNRGLELPYFSLTNFPVMCSISMENSWTWFMAGPDISCSTSSCVG